jgi:hypothetical protein
MMPVTVVNSTPRHSSSELYDTRTAVFTARCIESNLLSMIGKQERLPVSPYLLHA